ncbi:MAG: hypothetical protein AAF791_08530 [Bacteroidota bacterium]
MQTNIAGSRSLATTRPDAEAVPASARIQVFHDTLAVDETTSILKYFGQTVSTDRALANYSKQPIQGGEKMRINQIGFGFPTQFLVINLTGSPTQSDVRAAVAEYFANISGGVFRITSNDNSCAFGEGEIVFDYLTQEVTHVETSGTGAIVSLTKPRLVTLPEPVIIDPNAHFGVEIRFAKAAGLDKALATGTAQSDLGLRCSVNTAIYPESMTRQVSEEIAAQIGSGSLAN